MYKSLVIVLSIGILGMQGRILAEDDVNEDDVKMIMTKVRQKYETMNSIKLDVIKRKTNAKGKVKSFEGTFWIEGEKFKLGGIWSEGKERPEKRTVIYNEKVIWILKPARKAAFKIDTSAFSDDMRKKLVGSKRIEMVERLLQEQESFIVSREKLDNQELYVFRNKTPIKDVKAGTFSEATYWVRARDYLLYKIEANVFKSNKNREIKEQICIEYSNYQSMNADLLDEQFIFVPEEPWNVKDITTMTKLVMALNKGKK